jgi:hypothetical protein
MQVQGSQDTGRLLSNTSIICPQIRDNLGKLRLNTGRGWRLECAFPRNARSEDESAAD